MNTNYKTIISKIGLCLVFAVSVSAAPGDLDTTFGNGGIVITRGNNINHLNSASGMAIQSDGKIVAVGEGATGNTWDFAVVRYNTDGSLDTSFGGTGIVITPVGNSHDQALSVAIQADGKIVVAGTGCNGVGNCSSAGSSLAIVRYYPNGSLDTSFNGTGKVFNPASWLAKDLVIQTDGKIVVAAVDALFRYNPDGTPDLSFNGTGVVRIQDISVASTAIQTDGKIVIGGGSQNSFAAARYNPDGSVDNSFNGTGKVLTQVGNYSVAVDLAIQTDGKIVVVGESRSDPGFLKADFGCVRYLPNGSLDASFGGTGKITIPFGDSYNFVTSVAIQTDGKIVASGDSSTFNVLGRKFVVIRLNPTGSLDTTFVGSGKVATAFCCQDWTSEIAIQSDGKIVVLGNTDDILYDFYDPVVVRYQGGSNANIRTRFDFDGDRRADISVFRPSDRTWYLNQSTAGFTATQFGLSTDRITPADYDGDGRTDLAVYRDSAWYWLNSSDNSFQRRQFGIASDIPVPADYTGDGRAELAVYRNGVWWIQNLTSNQVDPIQFGLPTDNPMPADYDGDGHTDQAVYRNGEWHLNCSSQGYTVVNFGLSTDKLVNGDYDGDGKTDFAVYRDGTWYLLQSSQGFAAFQFGIASDIPAPADYDGDGRTDAAIFRDGAWYLRQTTSGISIRQFGSAGDIPVVGVH